MERQLLVLESLALPVPGVQDGARSLADPEAHRSGERPPGCRSRARGDLPRADLRLAHVPGAGVLRGRGGAAARGGAGELAANDVHAAQEGRADLAIERAHHAAAAAV